MYCCQSIIYFLKARLLQPGFFEQTELWRKRQATLSTLRDIYDRKVRNDFPSPSGVPFLSVPYNFALTLNVDWFQPSKRSNYAAGAMYVSVQNLPRRERYTNDNVFLLGVIPWC